MSDPQEAKAHSPLPWREEDDGLWVAASDGTFVASFIVPEAAEIASDRETRLANHRLIAAAPELLEALELMFKDFSSFRKQDQQEASVKALAAIKKARGD